MKGASCWVILLMFALLEAWRLKCLAVANQEESVCQICSCTVSWKGQVVKCTGKNLTQLPSSFPASTKILYLDQNNLTRISRGAFLNLRNLTYLMLQNNKISELLNGTFRGVNSLVKLYLQYNNITFIQEGCFENLLTLRTLMLDNNKISELLNGTFSGLDRLNYLSLINNRIQRIAPGTFEDLKALRSLSLNKNNITEIRNFTFKGLRYVKEIFLGNNNITTVEPGAFHSFNKSRFFNRLSIADNKLEIIKNKTFSGLNYLYTLYMDNNDIHRIEATGFYRMRKLRYLYLRGNRLRCIAYGTFYYTKNLYKLDLSRNNISSLPDGVFATLKYLGDLHLDFNGIKAIDPRSFSSSRLLYVLNLDGNQLTRINNTTFLGLKDLDQLNLQNNYIREIGKDSFKQMKHLTYLTLNNNNISEIEPHALQGLRTIKTIFLQYNRLLRVRKDDFSSLTRLETLYLFDNEISFFEPGSFPHARLSQLILFKNTGLSSLTIDAKEFQRINVTLYIYPGNLPSFVARTNTYAEVLDKNGFHCQYRNSDWFCDVCPVGTYSRGDGVSTGCHQCPAGGFYQDSVAAVGLTLDGNGCRRCPAGTFVHPKNAPGKESWDCKACPEGTNTTMFAGFRACWCLKAHYRLDRFGPCTACPGKGVECSDDKLNLLRGFYWNWADHDGNYSKSTYKLLIANLAIRNDKYTQTTRFVGKLPVAYKCLRESSCIGGIDSQCAESYTGPLCANCRRGYYKRAISCHKCPSQKLIAIQFGVLALSILILVLVIIKSNKLSTSGRRTIADIFLAHVKIIIGFYQVLAGILEAFSYIRWPSQVFVLESYIKFVQLNFLEIVSPTCLKETFKMNAYSHFMFTVAANVCIVIFPLFCYLLRLAWVKVKRHQRDKKEDMESKKPHLKVILFLLFVAYPATCVNIFKILPISCHELCPFEGSSTCPSFLRADYTIECGTNEHKKYTWAAYASLSYVVAFPIFLTYLVWKNHHQAQKRIKKFTPTETRGNMNQMAMAVLFLHENYSPSCWYWEGIEMARKVILSAGVVFVGSESRTQVGIAAMISGVFAMLHGRFRPIPDRFEDYLQMTSLLVTSFNLLIGVLLKIPSDDVTGNVDANNENWALGILLLMVNALVISIVFARYLIVFIQFIMDCRRNPRFNLGCLNITQETQAGDNDVSLQAMSNESQLDKPGINEEENKVCLCQADDTVIDKMLTDSE